MKPLRVVEIAPGNAGREPLAVVDLSALPGFVEPVRRRPDRADTRVVMAHVHPELRTALKVRLAEIDWTMDLAINFALVILLERLNAPEAERRRLFELAVAPKDCGHLGLRPR